MQVRLGGAALAMALLAAHVATAQAPPAPPPGWPGGGFAPLRLAQIANRAKADPWGVWASREVADDPRGADLYATRYRTAAGTVIISQLVSDACGSPSNCPVRVVLKARDGKRRVLLDQEQMCASANFFAIRPDLSAIRACDLTVPLGR